MLSSISAFPVPLVALNRYLIFIFIYTFAVLTKMYGHFLECQYSHKALSLLTPCLSCYVHSMCECLMTLSLTCCSTWWPRSGSWSFLSCSSQSMEAYRTSSYSLSSSRSLAKGSSRQPWRQGPGYLQEELTQVKKKGDRNVNIEHF